MNIQDNYTVNDYDYKKKSKKIKMKQLIYNKVIKHILKKMHKNKQHKRQVKFYSTNT